jgi:phage-related protein
MALGIDLETSPPTFINPDRNLSRKATINARQLKVKGYEQRASYGINPVVEKFTVTFKNRTKQDIDTLASFLQNREGTIAFSFTVPSSGGGEETLQVVCESFTQSFVTEDNGYSCTANLRKVNVPTFNGVVT